jgi:histidine ammonia-lyase
MDNIERILAIELMNAAQAIQYRDHWNQGFYRNVLAAYREEVSFIKEDRILHYDIEKTVSFLNSFQIEEDLLAQFFKSWNASWNFIDYIFRSIKPSKF